MYIFIDNSEVSEHKTDAPAIGVHRYVPIVIFLLCYCGSQCIGI